ncbi:MAG: RecQ family ATP-dependent DNA helicase, partial [Planctomycetota bacterium JB042]
MNAPDPLRTALLERFGHQEFRGFQREVIEHLLAGGDALVLLPTGGGKSLCYQLPALLLDGVTVVLSPLIALMQDQVDALRRRGLPATFVNSSLTRAEREKRVADVVAGRVKLLYVTPERFRKPEFVEAIGRVRVSLLAVDEAHCVSAWGHDFRPEYGRIGRIRDLLGGPPTVALTATATTETQADVRARLGIEGARLFAGGIERPNLHLAVREVGADDEWFDRLVTTIRGIAGPGIVYVALIKDLRDLQDRLLRVGVDVLVYHGDLDPRERRRVQREFLGADDRVVLATNAFGMGVDKPDIRFVVHAQVPGSVESLFQEVGRAGRDGAPSYCELLYLEEHLSIQRQFVEWANPDARFVRGVFDVLARWGETLHARELDDLRNELLVKNRSDGRVETTLALLTAEGVLDGSFERRDLAIVRPLERGEEDRVVASGKRDRDLRRLLEVVRYVQETGCRKRAIHGYFGLDWPADRPCGACDRCVDEESVRASFEPRRSGPAASGDDAAPVKVGDWIRVKKRFVVTVKSVTRKPTGGWVVQGQSAGDFKIRAYDLGKV